MEKVTIRVPASTSNLGPGFDCLGVALRIYNSITVRRAKDHPHQEKIVAQAANLFFKRTKLRPFAFSCSAEENIPRCRGLGSSATVRLGILHALNELIPRSLDRLSIFQFCAELEGHPDNAAPASFGGFTVARAEKAGALGAFLSGSGSTIGAVTLQNPQRVASAMQRAARSTSSQIVITAADNRGVQIRH